MSSYTLLHSLCCLPSHFLPVIVLFYYFLFVSSSCLHLFLFSFSFSDFLLFLPLVSHPFCFLSLIVFWFLPLFPSSYLVFFLFLFVLVLLFFLLLIFFVIVISFSCLLFSFPASFFFLLFSSSFFLLCFLSLIVFCCPCFSLLCDLLSFPPFLLSLFHHLKITQLSQHVLLLLFLHTYKQQCYFLTSTGIDTFTGHSFIKRFPSHDT